MNTNYYLKYLKYKKKYLELKGGATNFDPNIDETKIKRKINNIVNLESGEYEYEFDFENTIISSKQNKASKTQSDDDKIDELINKYRQYFSFNNENKNNYSYIRPIETIITKKFIENGNPLINYLLIKLGKYNNYDLTSRQYIYNIARIELNQLISNIESYIGTRIIDSLSSILKGIQPSDINNLQPTNKDVYILDLFHKYSNYLLDYNNDLRWHTCLNLLKNILKVDDLRRTIDIADVIIDSINNDLDNRAEKVVEKIISQILQRTDNSKIKLILMDGHGRIIYRCLEKLLHNINRVSIHVYDTDIWTDIWHKLTLPSINIDGSPTTYNENIFPNVNNDILQNNVIYLNFSGIGGNDKVMELISILESINQENIGNLIISFSNVRAAEIINIPLITYLSARNFIKLGRREDFVTYYLPSR